ncbi:hypothetical protein NDU88_001974 [Pleurodeles waltl]|uniref:Uncharacterized protein n=1 Tax=Pleurodeles waltl TaxID=8319 RepID=A0AAV7T210_PLEWA|nr:hypothetical protein NDU88_001974 [Pleurodeles waltl]
MLGRRPAVKLPVGSTGPGADRVATPQSRRAPRSIQWGGNTSPVGSADQGIFFWLVFWGQRSPTRCPQCCPGSVVAIRRTSTTFWCLGAPPRSTATRVSPIVFPFLLSEQSCFCTSRPCGRGPGPRWSVRHSAATPPPQTNATGLVPTGRRLAQQRAGQMSYLPLVQSLHSSPGSVPATGPTSLQMGGWEIQRLLCPLSSSPRSQALAPRKSGCLLGLRFGPQRAGRYVAGGPARAAPPFSLPPWARPKRYTARAQGEAASLWGGPLPGASSWSGPASPEVLRAPPRSPGEQPAAAQTSSCTGSVRSSSPRRRQSPLTSAGMSRPGANAAALSAGRARSRRRTRRESAQLSDSTRPPTAPTHGSPGTAATRVLSAVHRTGAQDQGR